MGERLEAEAQSSGEDAFDYESIATGYYDDVYHRGRGIQSKWHHLKFLRVSQELQAGARHLDIGCGPGTFIGQLPNSVQSLGVDLAAPQVAYATNRYGSDTKAFKVVPASGLPFEAESFDAVTSVELLEHLSADEGHQHLEEVLRVLKPGGQLTLTTPNYRSLYPLLEMIVNRVGEVSYADQHITHYHPAMLRGLLSDCGFLEVAVSAYMFAAPFLAPLGWGFADRVAAWEPRLLTDRLGFLLFATARKAA